MPLCEPEIDGDQHMNRGGEKKKMSSKQFIAAYGQPFQFNWLAPWSLWLIDTLKIELRFRKWLYVLQGSIAMLYGAKNAQYYLKMFIVQMLSAMQLSLAVFIGLYMFNGDVLLLLVGVCMMIAIPFLLIKDLARKVERRRRLIVMELPLFLNKLILLVNAGETVNQAIMRSIKHIEEQSNHPFYMELSLVLKQLNNNYSFQQAMEELSRRCAVQEVSLFTNTIVLNYRRGGSELVAALRGLAHQLWMTRKNLAKTLGEEASSKLVFPLVIIFVIVIVIVGAPAVMMLES